MEPSKLSKKFDRQANVYERQRNNHSLEKWRYPLLRHAKGEVLELAVGAGANFAYYPSDVKVTAVDISPKMISKAKEIAAALHIETEFLLADIEALEFPENSFDTIVSTLSFCGYEHPVRLLNRLNHWCKPEGKILLLEHGISSNPLLGLMQKVMNPIQHKWLGCHLKRDMPKIIQASNIEIQKHESHWQGIFHLVWAKPDKRNESSVQL